MPCTCPWLHHAHARGIAMHRCMERPRAWAWYSHAQFGETPPSLSLIRYSWTALKSDIFYMIHPCHLIIMSQGHMTSLNALHCNGLLFRKLLASQLWCKVNGTLLSRGKQINAGAWLAVFWSFGTLLAVPTWKELSAFCFSQLDLQLGFSDLQPPATPPPPPPHPLHDHHDPVSCM